MVPDEDLKTDPPAPEAAPASNRPPRGGRRAGRGRRGRRPGHARPARDEVSARGQTGETRDRFQEKQHSSETPGESALPTERAGEPVDAPEPSLRTPASRETIQKAIDEVNHIIETLRETLEEMDEVLEMLEITERQQTADEKEIESLRRALRNLQRPRGSGVSVSPESQRHAPP